MPESSQQMLTGGSVLLAVIFFSSLLCSFFFFFLLSPLKDLWGKEKISPLIPVKICCFPWGLTIGLKRCNSPWLWGTIPCGWDCRKSVHTGRDKERDKSFPDYSPLLAKLEGEGRKGWAPPALSSSVYGTTELSSERRWNHLHCHELKAPESFPALHLLLDNESFPAFNISQKCAGIPLCLALTLPTSHASNSSFDAKYLYLLRL